MEKIKERTNKYEISVKLKSNGYYIARISINLGNATSTRLEKSGTSKELAVYNLLDYIDTNFHNGLITCKIDDRVPQRLVKSINNIGIVSPEATEKVLLIVNKINQINSHILNSISLENNVIPFYNRSINNVPTPIVNNTALPEKEISKTQTGVIIEDFFIEWVKYKFSLCVKTDENPKPLSKKTIDGYYRLIRDNILPYIKKHKKLYLSQLTDDFIKGLIKNAYGYTSKRQIYIILNMIFKYAIKQKKAKVNPLENIDKPVQPAKTEEDKADYIEPDEQDKWLDIFEKEDTDMSLLFETMLLTGIRPECACGLKWNALDLVNKELIIKNAYKEFIVYDDNMNPIGHTRHDDKLKTPESYRRIPISDELIELLLRHKNKQKELFRTSRAIKKQNRKWSEDEYMFLSRTYRPYVSDTLSSALPKICDKYNLKRITPYGLRHSFATFYAEIGTDETVLMRLMGHSSFQTTQKYYIRVSSKRKRLAAEEAYKIIYDRRKAS